MMQGETYQHITASCAGLTRASIFFARIFPEKMDCRVKPGNDGGARGTLS
jgi:hypothetical protein